MEIEVLVRGEGLGNQPGRLQAPAPLFLLANQICWGLRKDTGLTQRNRSRVVLPDPVSRALALSVLRAS